MEYVLDLNLFCTLLWELRAPISMGGEIFWHIYYLIQNLLILHLNVKLTNCVLNNIYAKKSHLPYQWVLSTPRGEYKKF